MSKSLASSPRRKSARRFWLVLLLIVVPAWTVPVVAQDAPPPGDEKVKMKPKPKPAKGGGGGAAGPAAPASPTLLLHADMNCTVTIDGANPTRVVGNESKTITIQPGEHLLKAVSEDGRQMQQVVKAGGPGQQTVVQINLASLPLSARPEDFDRAAAKLWLAISDLPVSGRYAGAILNKSFGFHDKTLSQAVFGVQQQIKREMDEFKKFIPPDPSRKRIFDEFTRIAGEADKYVDLLTKAIAAAQSANSWMGEPSNMYNQARAMLDTTLIVPSDIVNELRRSSTFQQALPMDRRNRLGLSNDPQDIQLGADYYQSTPTLLAVVDKGGLADKMGFKVGDRLVSAGGRGLNSVWDFKVALRQNAGKKIAVTYERQGKQENREISVPSSLP
jgi:hypothetical protein